MGAGVKVDDLLIEDGIPLSDKTIDIFFQDFR